MKNTNSNISTKSRFLCLFLFFFGGGVLGFHRMYVGKIGSGILQLLFGWLTLFLWNTLDFFLILFGWFSDVEGKRIAKW